MKRSDDPAHVLIVYYSRFGVLKQMAEAIADGVRRVPDAQVSFLRVEDQPVDRHPREETAPGFAQRRTVMLTQLAGADALIVGAPAYFGSMAAAVKRLFEDSLTASALPGSDRSRPWGLGECRDKVGAAFTSSGTPHGGNELALHSILTLFMHLGMIVVTPGQGEPILENPSAPYGATAIAGATGASTLTSAEQDGAQALGERVARTTVWLQMGRAARSQPGR